MAGRFRARGIAIALAAGAAAVGLLGGAPAAAAAAQPWTSVTTSSPTVTKVSPSSGPAAGGTTVTITGTNFASPATVTFGGVAATGVQVLSPTQLTAISPAGTGKVDVRVTAPGGTSAISPADKFSYT